MRAEILIAGGGVMGTSVALSAAQRTDPLDQPVVLLERHALAAGSSGRSGAILRQIYAEPRVATMARDSLRSFAAFEARAGRSIGFRRTGVLTVVGPAQADWRERLPAICERLSDIGIRIELVDVPRMRELVPGVSLSAGSLGAWEPDAGFVDPFRTVEAFAAQARAYGAVTRPGVELEEILVEGGRAVGARTSEGEYRAEHVVIVAGPWSAALLERVGVSLPLRIVRPECHFVEMPLGEVLERTHEEEALGFDVTDDLDRWAEQTSQGFEPTASGLHPVVIDLEKSFYARCEPGERRVRVGHTDYAAAERLAAPEPFEEEVSGATKSWAHAVLGERLPEYADQPDAGSMAGWYTLTPDAQPLIGPVPGIERLYVVTGFSGHGFKLAPSVGEGMAQMLAGEPVSAFDEAFFSPARFHGGEEWTGRFGL